MSGNVVVVQDDEKVNLLGIKDIAEVGIVSMDVTIVNRVFHPTETRARERPIRSEVLL